MSNKDNKITGAYLYEKVLGLIDYAGDISRNQGRPSSYSAHFSPNNIKKLYISPIWARVDFHVPVNGTSHKEVALGNMYNVCVSKEDYKAMITAISKPLICSCIEEIIFIEQGANGSYLTSRECSWETLVETFYSGSDTKEKLLGRYVRLHDVIILHCEVKEVKEYLNSGMLRKDTFISNSSLASQGSAEYFHKDDWYKNIRINSGTYAFDAKTGQLYQHFVKTRDHIEQSIKDNEVKKFTEERIKGIKEEFDNAFTSYKAYRKAVSIISNMSSYPNGVFSISTTDITGIKDLQLYKCDGLPKDYPHIIAEQADAKTSYEKNVEKLKEYNKTASQGLALCVQRTLLNLKTVYPLAFRAICNSYSGYLSAPPDVIKMLQENSDKQLSTSKIKTALPDLLALFVEVFIQSNPAGKSSTDKYAKPETWKEVLKNA